MNKPALTREKRFEMNGGAVSEMGRSAESPAPGAEGWPGGLLATALSLLFVIVLFSQTALTMVEKWWSVGTYGHGFLVVPVSLYLIWRRREVLARVPPRPELLGLILLAGAALLWFAGDTAGVLVAAQIGLVAMICSVVLTLLGWPVVRRMLFPLFFLFFAVPAGDFLIPPLQQSTATLAVRFLQLAGIPVYLDGLMIDIPSGRFFVAEACSGVRFLVSTVALGCLGAYFFFTSWWRRLMFVALSFVVPVVANGVRAFGIVMVAYLTDNKWAVGFDHLVYGWVFLSVVTLCLLGVGMLFRQPEPDPEAAIRRAADEGRRLAARGRRTSLPAAALLAAIVAAAFPAYGYVLQRSAGMNDVAHLHPPRVAAPWSPTEADPAEWQPAVLGADLTLLQAYEADGDHVDLFVAYFRRQHQAAEVVNEQHRIAGGHWLDVAPGSTTTVVDGHPLEVQSMLAKRDVRERVVWTWYWVDGQFTSNSIVAKLLELRAKMLGGRADAANFVISAEYVEDPAEAVAAMQRFLEHVGPLEAVFDGPRGDGAG